jgi:hypothetical protein
MASGTTSSNLVFMQRTRVKSKWIYSLSALLYNMRPPRPNVHFQRALSSKSFQSAWRSHQSRFAYYLGRRSSTQFFLIGQRHSRRWITQYDYLSHTGLARYVFEWQCFYYHAMIIQWKHFNLIHAHLKVYPSGTAAGPSSIEPPSRTHMTRSVTAAMTSSSRSKYRIYIWFVSYKHVHHTKTCIILLKMLALLPTSMRSENKKNTIQIHIIVSLKLPYNMHITHTYHIVY